MFFTYPIDHSKVPAKNKPEEKPFMVRVDEEILQVIEDVKPDIPEHELAADVLSLKEISDGKVTLINPFVGIVFFVTILNV